MTWTNLLRKDIQVLRAVAVAMVVLFHFWPGHFKGGFAGVDVFFVISGFLITSHLVGQERIRFAEFWARRARRLLPAAFVVILFTLAACYFISPALGSDYAREGIASVFYSENWVLAANATDYFAAQGASPFQHYWSLAVEEQFYLFWPLLIAALLVWRKRLASGVALVSIASFVFGVVDVSNNPAFAYFNPVGRVWEFGVGALVATASFAIRGRAVRGALSLIGFAGLGATIVLYSPSVAFPGVPALLPVLATGLVLAAGREELPAWMQRRMSFAPVQFVGDVSYSLYLWHWPLIIIPAYFFNGNLSTWLKLLLLALSVALAWLTKRFVEDPVRQAGFLTKARARRTLLLALAASLFVGAVGGFVYWVADSNTKDDIRYYETLTLPEAKKDASDPGSKCMTKALDSEVILCDFGKLNSAKRVLLVGDSHAATHLRAMTQIATVRGWHLVLAYKAGCSFSLVQRNTLSRGVSCAAWNENLETKLATMPAFNLVVTNDYSANHLADYISQTDWESLAIDGYRAAWKPLIERGAKIVVIRDNPHMTPEMQTCWETSTTDASNCQMPLSRALSQDLAVLAAKGWAGVVDLTEYYCPNGTCPAKIGSVYVYRNKDHISGTFDGRLWRELGGKLVTWLK